MRLTKDEKADCEDNLQNRRSSKDRLRKSSQRRQHKQKNAVVSQGLRKDCASAWEPLAELKTAQRSSTMNSAACLGSK